MILFIPMRIILIISLLFLPLFYSQAQNLLKDDARVYRDRGYELQSIGDIKGALSCYQKAVQLDPYFIQAYNDLGVIHESLGDIETARVMYERVLELDPEYLPACTNLAFIYEKKGNIERATFYWKKRYELGEEGDYWKEIARQHLLKLGTYPQIRKKVLEDKAAELSKALIIKREQEELEIMGKVKHHFDIGSHAFSQGDYVTATQEFKTVISIDSPDKGYQKKAKELLEKMERFQLREQALYETEHALDYINNNDYLSAGEKLREALSVVLRIAQSK